MVNVKNLSLTYWDDDIIKVITRNCINLEVFKLDGLPVSLAHIIQFCGLDHTTVTSLEQMHETRDLIKTRCLKLRRVMMESLHADKMLAMLLLAFPCLEEVTSTNLKKTNCALQMVKGMYPIHNRNYLSLVSTRLYTVTHFSPIKNNATKFIIYFAMTRKTSFFYYN